MVQLGVIILSICSIIFFTHLDEIENYISIGYKLALDCQYMINFRESMIGMFNKHEGRIPLDLQLQPVNMKLHENIFLR